jgi:ribosomal-protein-alanine N-acetyltransferase
MLTGARATSTHITTRAASVEDVDRLVELDELCFASRTWPREAWCEVVRHSAWYTLVAEAPSGELAAAAVLLCQRPLASVASLAVAPSWRRRGVGARLLGECLRLCRDTGASLVALELDADNEPALRLYHRFGFRVRRAFQEDGVARLEMVLSLGTRP